MTGRTRIGVAAFAAVVLTSLAACLSERPTAAAPTAENCNVQLPPEAFGATVVTIRNFAFTPDTVRIRPGAKVTWVNCDAPGGEPHTSTSDTEAWSSPLLQAGASYTREFTDAGVFPYHCQPHPGMRGAVIVE